MKEKILKNKFKKSINMNLKNIHILVDLNKSKDLATLLQLISNLKELPISFHFLNENNSKYIYDICDYAIDFSDNPDEQFYINLELPVILKNKITDHKCLIQLDDNKLDFFNKISQRSLADKSEVILIFGHFDSDEKLELLVEGITEYKKNGYVIILSTNSKIPNYIFDLVDFVIYDSENPVIMKEDYINFNISPTIFWIDFGFYKQSSMSKSNYNYAVVKLIKNGLVVSKNNGFKKTHVINYDHIIYDNELIKKNSEILDNHDIVLYDCFGNLEWFNASFYSINNDIIQHLDFLNINSKEDFYSRGYDSVFEVCIKQFFSKFNYFLSNQSEIYYRNIIDFISNQKGSPHNTINHGDKTTFLNLAKDYQDNYYIFFKTNDTINLNIKIDNYPVQLIDKSCIIEINLEYLEKGITAIIPEYDYSVIFDTNSNFADCEIRDNQYIKILQFQ